MSSLFAASNPRFERLHVLLRHRARSISRISRGERPLPPSSLRGYPPGLRSGPCRPGRSHHGRCPDHRRVKPVQGKVRRGALLTEPQSIRELAMRETGRATWSGRSSTASAMGASSAWSTSGTTPMPSKPPGCRSRRCRRRTSRSCGSQARKLLIGRWTCGCENPC